MASFSIHRDHFLKITHPLLRWFDTNKRPMPWRADRDPYRIWVSEVMLQQTTVAAVIPYFERFLTRFPTVDTLAAAHEQDVLKLWEGLGYYRRAKHLHAAAKMIVDQHDGKFPEDADAAAALPGVGRYILGAVLSQAFEKRLPIVEANSVRLLARLFAYRGDPRTGDGHKWVWAVAESVLPRKRIGDFNQALMELGSQVCTPVNPKCGRCPLRKQCQAFARNLQDEIPPAKSAKVYTLSLVTALVIRCRHRLLLRQRPADATRGAGLWEFLTVDGNDNLKRRVRTLTGLSVTIGREIATLEYTVTRFRYRLTAVECFTSSSRISSGDGAVMKWFPVADLASLPMSTPQRRIVRELSNPQKRLF